MREYIDLKDFKNKVYELQRLFRHKSDYQLVNDMIAEMPIVKQKQDKWIYCFDELPKEKGWYQCACYHDEIFSKPIVRDLYYYPNLKAFVDNVRYEENGMEDIMKYNWMKYVYAWKELPEAPVVIIP